MLTEDRGVQTQVVSMGSAYLLHEISNLVSAGSWL